MMTGIHVKLVLCKQLHQSQFNLVHDLQENPGTILLHEGVKFPVNNKATLIQRAKEQYILIPYILLLHILFPFSYSSSKNGYDVPLDT
ncbi:Protein of unknown function [Gryllus bimaculatus]|nr:Protein of unknown function [Gryllus bimaculatus]